MTITSPVRTARIIEEVAEKHGLSVAVMLCSRWRRDMVLARSEVAYRLKTELNLSYRQIAAKMGLVPARVCSLLKEHKKREAQARLFVRPPDPDGRIRELEEELARLAGTLLCERLATILRLRLRCAIGLAIITEAYPRVVRGPSLLQLYDDACLSLGYGYAGEGANYRLMDKNMSQLNAHFLRQGWPAPARSGDGRGARQLSDEAAEWMAKACGAPRASLVLAVQENGREAVRNSPPVRVAQAL